MSRFSIRHIAATVAALLLTACGQSPNTTAAAARASAIPAELRASPSGAERELAAVRRATARFQDPRVAIAEGYVSLEECIALPGTGAMGVHFVKAELMGLTKEQGRVHGTDAAIDPARPELLVYAPQPDGSLKLGAVEYYTSRAAWEATGATEAPTIFGVPFNAMQDDPATADVDEGHGFTPHYDLHVWLWQENPNGMFAQWNPRVSCPAGHGAGHGAAH